MTAIALVKGPWCQSCSYGVLRSFAAVAGLSIGPQRARKAPLRRAQRRPFSSIPRRLEEPSAFSSYKALGDRKENESQPVQHGKQFAPEEIVPWYLQEETPRKKSHPFRDRQRIPDLPQNPPPILQGLLKHVSVDIGLDDLALLDLRNLDPPPALGAELLMIIGSARSAKHLNASANRLCRWLRTTYKLRPYADGLLGRNELKLKLRRKARRAKLLSSVSSSMAESSDDGITTGWVCVNVGEIESGSGAAENLQPEGFVGFGGHAAGVKIVVQMLTEEKRAELDLEGLWEPMLDLESYADEREPLNFDGERPADPVRQAPSLSFRSAADFGGSPRSTRMRGGRGAPQRRSFHTIQSQKAAGNSEANLEYEGLDPSSLEPQLAETYNTSPSDVILRSLLSHLSDRSRIAATSQMGEGYLDRDSTTFLKSFYERISGLPIDQRNDGLLNLYSYGVRFRHPGYPKDVLLSHLDEMRISGSDISKMSLFNVVRALLIPIPGEESNGEAPFSSMKSVPSSNISDAIGIVEDMNLRGFDSLMGDIFLMLHEAVASQMLMNPRGNDGLDHEVESPEIPDATISAVQATHDRLHDMMEVMGVDWSNDESYMTILQLHADGDHWKAFWRVWVQISLRLKPRSKELYSFMFRAVAQSGHQKGCVEALDTYLPMMGYEEPPVVLEREVARSVMECLMAIEPGVELSDFSEDGRMGKWARLWHTCGRAPESQKDSM